MGRKIQFWAGRIFENTGNGLISVWIQRSGIKDKKYELYPVGNSFNLEQISKQKISLPNKRI